MNVIKTAIITIMISFASGLLLNYFTNLGPRILCNVRNGKPKKMDDKEEFTYIVTVKNPSKKTIHELTVHIQNEQNNLKSTDFKITKGLKFDSNIEDNILEVYIPFLSKGDEFSVTVYLENKDGIQKKPIVIIRSPENFKEIDSSEKNGILLALANIPKNIEQVMNKVSGTEKTTNRENAEVLSGNSKVSKNKKVIIIIVLFVLVVIAGVAGALYFKGTAANTQNSVVKTPVTKQSNATKGSRTGTNGTSDTKRSTETTNAATDGKRSGTNSATGAGTNSSTDTKESGANAAKGTGSSGSGTNATKGAGSSETTNTTPTTNTTNTTNTTTPTTNTTTAPPTTDPAGAGTNTTTSK